MKTVTRSFYEQVVHAALLRIVQGLDEALDLSELARGAALAPLHFHRIFRGMVGETPLELHRRLRLERAAWRLAGSEDLVTSIAFDAGYETHESFTRSFREAYSCAPRAFRMRAREAEQAKSRPPPIELAARCGVHFRVPPQAELVFATTYGGITMNVEIQTLPERRVAAVSHVGPYNTIFEACQRLGEIAAPAGLLAHKEAAMVALYHDDPETTPQAELRSEAGLVVPESASIPKELNEIRIPAGKYARTTHVGPYTGLGDVWTRFMGDWLPQSGHRVGNGVMYELYVNTPETAAPEALRTDLYLSIE